MADNPLSQSGRDARELRAALEWELERERSEIEKARYAQIRSQRRVMLIGLTAITLLLTGYVVMKVSRGELSDAPRAAEITVGVFALVGIAGFMMYDFLQTSRPSSNREFDVAKVQLDEHVRRLKTQLSLDDKTRKALVEELKKRVSEQAAVEQLDQLKTQAAKAVEAASWQRHFDRSYSRLNDMIDALGRRGTINMILGVLTGLSGVALLAYVIFSDHKPLTEPLSFSDFVLSFLPRISVVAIIEVFAYFFLKMYRSNLVEIKYFQNEATNVESKFAALAAAWQRNDQNLITSVVTAMTQVERNPILDADRTTIELEHERIAATPTLISIPQMVEILKEVGAATRRNQPEEKK